MSTKPRTLTREESERLLSSFDAELTIGKKRLKILRNKSIFLLMIDAGLRVGEAVRLIISDLFFNNSTVLQLTVRAEISKSKRSRDIPLSDRLRAALQEYYDAAGLKNSAEKSFPVFYGGNFRTNITTRQIERIISSAASDVLGKQITPHMLRHTCGTNLMRVTDMRTVQEILGHKHLSSTQIYTHPNGDDMKKAIDKAANGSAV